MDTCNLWTKYNEESAKEVNNFAQEYIDFLSNSKTEREFIDAIVNEIEENGYVELQSFINSGKKAKAGDKIYAVQMNKSIAMFNIGTEAIENGLNILGAHIDSPRLDVKQNPLYEEKEIAYLDTHYYGGVKKYQWVTIPLAIHGVVVKKDGTTVDVVIGEDEDDPVFFISDLLIHLSQEQLEKKAAKVIEGEALDIIVGNKPLVIDSNKDDKNTIEKDGIKKNFINILKDSYDINEDDFISAELEVVPAGKARFAGIDKSMILGYGHDDKVCAFPSYKAMLKVNAPKRTTCCILVDKEEIGSVGATGMKSKFFENSVAELINMQTDYSDILLRRCLANSYMLSSDVSAAFDPSYASVFDKNNSAMLGHGMVLNKYTGARGKSGSNDCNAEYIAHLRNIFTNNNVGFQTAELGKVDVGGGGTIAYILALYGMNVIDAGIAVLNMHAPWEAVSTVDLYETYRGYIAFLNDAGLE